MSEHPKIDQQNYRELVASSSQSLGSEDRERIFNHLVFSFEHQNDGFEVFYGGGRGDEGLKTRFDQETNSHSAAVLRGEIMATDLWPQDLD